MYRYIIYVVLCTVLCFILHYNGVLNKEFYYSLAEYIVFAIVVSFIVNKKKSRK